MNFEIGQRWLSEAEPELGLGVIYEIGHKIIKMSFPVCEEFRVYGSKSAPLRRAIFHEGEEVSSLDGEKLVVEQVIWEEGLAIYKGQDKIIKEAEKDLREKCQIQEKMLEVDLFLILFVCLL